MIRRIIRIDETRCNGCGLCASACHEGAIALVEGKARLLREDFCDGLGDCLPACPEGAISIEEREAVPCGEKAMRAEKGDGETARSGDAPSALGQWPVQLRLAPVQSPIFCGAGLLVAADCTAYAYASFHERFMRGRVTLIGCPKLDHWDYSGKLAEILRSQDLREITLVRMEVPCCGGLEYALGQAMAQSGKRIPWKTVVISTEGRILEERICIPEE